MGDFVLYFGIIADFSGWLIGLIDKFHQISRMHLQMMDLANFINMPDKSNRSSEVALPKGAVKITLTTSRLDMTEAKKIHYIT